MVDQVIGILKWIGDNYANIMQSLAVLLGALGIVVETLNRLIPSKSEESALTKIGKFLVDAGDKVKKLMDLLKIPNFVVKAEKEKKD